MTYIAQESFRSEGGEKFSFGQEIGSYQYGKLTRTEQMKFRRKFNDDDDEPARSIALDDNWPVNSDIWRDDSSPSPQVDTPSFGGYEGGDSGGAGSGGSWDNSDYGSSDGGGGDAGGSD